MLVESLRPVGGGGPTDREHGCGGQSLSSTPTIPGQFLPNGARAKSGLNRSISDAGWGQFVSILARQSGRRWAHCGLRSTPGTPPTAARTVGTQHAENRVTQAEFACQRCGHSAPADEHAARNILRAGLALHAQRGVKRSWRLPAVREVTMQW